MTVKVSYLAHQKEVFVNSSSYVVYAKGRRCGGTMGAVNRLIELAYLKPGSSHLWIDTVHRNIERYVKRYFAPILANEGYVWRSALKVLEFPTGSYCDFGSVQKPESLEGFSYDYIWLNEAGIILKDEVLYYQTLLPMLINRSDSQMFIIGTPKGPGLFSKMYEWGKSRSMSDWISYRHPSKTNFLLSERQLERIKQNMPERVYQQELLAKFVAGDGAVFHDIKSIVTAKKKHAATAEYSYVLGVDLGRYRDYTVIWVGEKNTNTAVYCDRFQGVSWPAQIQRIMRASQRFNDAPIYIDATGHGDPATESLCEAGLTVHPVVFSAPSKRILIDRLSIGIEQKKFGMYANKETISELESYEYQYLPSGHIQMKARGTGHDDCVVALALCYFGMISGGNDYILGRRIFTDDVFGYL